MNSVDSASQAFTNCNSSAAHFRPLREHASLHETPRDAASWVALGESTVRSVCVRNSPPCGNQGKRKAAAVGESASEQKMSKQKNR